MTEEPPGREIMIVNARDVIMKMIAAAVVALLRIVAALRAPKAVCVPPPPKAPARLDRLELDGKPRDRLVLDAPMLSSIGPRTVFLNPAISTVSW